MQDLKTGQLVGATPWKQQVMLVFGVVVSALVIPPILQLLFEAYGIAGVFPRAGMDPAQMLLAPQASLMAILVKGIFSGEVQTTMMLIGGVIAIACHVADWLFKARGWRVLVLAVGIGIYLPVDTSSPLVIGGLVSYLLHRRVRGMSVQHDVLQRALLLACGLVAGAAVMGVLLAIPFALSGSSNILNLLPEQAPAWVPHVASLIVTLCLCLWFLRLANTRMAQ